ncbi:MAG: GNAT family protein [bacterium]
MLFKIELAKKADSKQIFNLSNDNLVRKNSFNSDKIKWLDHLDWFENKINSERTIFFVVKAVINNEFIGQVRFDKESEKDGSYFIAISLVEKFRGKSLGTMILKEATKKAMNDFNIKKIFAYIKNNNKASLKCFINCDYKVFEKTIINGYNLTKLLYK